MLGNWNIRLVGPSAYRVACFMLLEETMNNEGALVAWSLWSRIHCVLLYKLIKEALVLFCAGAQIGPFFPKISDQKKLQKTLTWKNAWMDSQCVCPLTLCFRMKPWKVHGFKLVTYSFFIKIYMKITRDKLLYCIPATLTTLAHLKVFLGFN